MLLQLLDVSVAFGAGSLLDHVELVIERGERVCLVGRNGSGKSTLLKVIDGEILPDSGQLQVASGARIAALPQEVPQDLSGSVFQVAAEGLGELGRLIGRYQTLSQQLAQGEHDRLAELEQVQHALETQGGWQLRPRVEQVLSRLGLAPELDFTTLSGGLKRRALLARALVAEPDLLLLDEPTNHLDIAAITWLEDFLCGYGGALLFISHDRRFLDRVATRIIELDRGRLTSYPGSYQAYLERKQAMLEAEATQQAHFDKKLAEEEVWIRQGIKARRTRNEGRVRALIAMRQERQARRERQGSARMGIQEAEGSGKLVSVLENVSYSAGDRPLIRNFSTTILRGDKVGLIGPNGVGKTTLLNLILGRLQPDSGQVKLGSRLEVAYFDQLRGQLDEEASVLDNVAGGSDKVVVNGRPKHVMGYLQDFLFPAERARAPVRALSGGERNRLLLAKLFTRPANVLVLDEPTNDLDVETLDLLEDLLAEFSGTVLLVSHDRAFLDNVVTSVMAFEGEGMVREYVGGYADWLRQRPAAAEPAPKPAPRPAAPAPSRERPRKLGYQEQRELAALPGRIEALESDVAQVQQRLADPALYREEPAAVTELKQRLESLDQELAQAYQRWEALEALL